jgi:ketosteroid isomerase-like protein
VAACLHDAVVWQVAGANALAGTFLGVDEVLGAMRRYGEHSGRTLKLDTKAIVADGGHMVAIHEATATKGDFHYRAHEIDVFHVSDGRIVAMWSFSEDQAATDRLWS